MLAFFCLFLTIAFVNGSQATGNSNGSPDYVPGQLIIKLRPDVKAIEGPSLKSLGVSSIDSLSKSKGVVDFKRLFPNEPLTTKARSNYADAFRSHGLQDIFLVSIDPALDVEATCQEYKQLPEVGYAEPDYFVYAAAVPNDSNFSQQWGLNNTGQTGGTPDKDIDAPEAWDLQQGSASVKIAVLDTGVDLDHPDLNSKILLVPGSDLVNSDSDPQDDNGHGTHIAGVAAAETNNAQGVAGVDWNAKIMPIKVLNSSGVGSLSVLAQGINLAVTNGADVINISLGSYSNSGTLQTAVSAASTSALIVAAAGNDGLSTPYYPAAYDQVLGVGAFDHNGAVWAGSNYGDWVSCLGPGVNIYSTYLNDAYASQTGTSDSAAFASGIGSLLFAQNPAWSSNLARAQILNTLDSTHVNALTALSTIPVVDLGVVSLRISDTSGDGDGVADAGETVDLYVTLRNNWKDATAVTGILSTTDGLITVTDSNGSWGNIGALQEVENTAAKFSFSVSPSTPGKHVVPFQLALTADAGSYSDTQSFTTETQRGFNFSGVIASNTEWATGTTVIVTGNILVTAGATLTIRPDVEVRFNGDYYLRVDGTLQALGTPDAHVVFTSNLASPTPGSWGNVWFTDSSADWTGATETGCLLRYTDVLYGGGYDVNGYGPTRRSGGGFAATGASPALHYCTFTYCSAGEDGGAIYTKDSSVEIRDCLLTQNSAVSSGGAIFLGNAGSPTVINTIVEENTAGALGGGMRCVADATVSYCVFHNNESKRGGGVQIQQSSPFFSNTSIANNNSNFSSIFSQPARAAINFEFTDAIFTSCSIIGNIGGEAGLTNINSSFPTLGSCNITLHEPKTILLTFPPTGNVSALSNYWGDQTTQEMNTEGPNSNIETFTDFYDDFNLGVIDYANWLQTPEETAPPFLWKVGTDPSSPVGLETVDFNLTFSKPMNTGLIPTVYFQLDGNPSATVYDLSNDLVWDIASSILSASFTFDETIPTGTYRLFVGSGEDLDGMPSPDNSSFTFNVDTAGAAGSLVLDGEFSGGCIHLTWNPSSSPNLLGYNVYRSETPGSGYEKINFAPVTDAEFSDCSVEPGATYYYVYTVVNTAFDESPLSNEVSQAAAEAPSGFTGEEWTLYE